MAGNPPCDGWRSRGPDKTTDDRDGNGRRSCGPGSRPNGRGRQQMAGIHQATDGGVADRKKKTDGRGRGGNGRQSCRPDPTAEAGDKWQATHQATDGRVRRKQTTADADAATVTCRCTKAFIVVATKPYFQEARGVDWSNAQFCRKYLGTPLSTFRQDKISDA